MITWLSSKYAFFIKPNKIAMSYKWIEIQGTLCIFLFDLYGLSCTVQRYYASPIFGF